MAFAITPLPTGETKIEVSTLARGQGSDFRKWLPQHPDFLTQDKLRINPILVEKIYLQKPSAASGVAPILFAALGSQYVGQASAAEASPGKVCPVTGKTESSSAEHTGTAEAIDRAGMAAGLGLLTSQAKGELEGQKSTFLLKDVPLANLSFRTEVQNKDSRQLIMVVTPVILELAE